MRTTTREFFLRKPRRYSRWKQLTAVAIASLLLQAGAMPLPAVAGPAKQKLRGYITGQIDDTTISILDDQLHLERAKIFALDSSGEHAISRSALTRGLLIEAEGIWKSHHEFDAQRITVDGDLMDKHVHQRAYLQEEPKDSSKIKRGEPAELKADGERLLLEKKTKRSWSAPESETVNSSVSGSTSAAETSIETAVPAGLAGYRVEYHGTRGPDGTILTSKVVLGAPAPPDAYNMPHGMRVVRAKDPQTGIDILEFQHGTKVEGRVKLFPEGPVQRYVSQLGDSLLPAGSRGTTRPIEFRFFVVEDPTVNASALPDGTVLVNTALLGAVDNEAQLAFVLSHEISHVLQVHYWREANETRAEKIGLVLAGIAATYYIGDLGIFFTKLGLASVANGHQRELENQADRLGLQNIIERGYDPRPAPGFMKIIVDRYGSRTTSKLWSNHDSSLLRGSYLTVQLMEQYPAMHFEGAKVDTPEFQAMREVLGPVKIESQ
jgi:hypothetical protein